MKVGDTVQVIRQPTNQCVHLVGTVGVIEEMAGEVASIQAYEQGEGCHGGGVVPLSCLRLIDLPWLNEAHAAWERQIQAHIEWSDKKNQEDAERFRAAIAKAAKELGITQDQVELAYRKIVKAIANAK